MYGWVSLTNESVAETIAVPDSEADATVVDRCDECGSALVRASDPADLTAEMETLIDPERGVIVAPNRGSVQASIGGAGWAALLELQGRLLYTKRGLELLADRQGRTISEPGSPPVGRGQRWMWQTLVNALTLRPNLISRARSGALRPVSGRGRAGFAIDVVVTVLAAPLVALVSFPLELISSVIGRGGVLEARLTDRGSSD
jgi:hypothetical protein